MSGQRASIVAKTSIDVRHGSGESVNTVAGRLYRGGGLERNRVKIRNKW